MKITQKVVHVLREAGIYLFPITFLGIFLDQWFTASLEAELMAPKGASGLIWLWGALSILNNLIYPLLLLVFVLAALADQEPSKFVAKHFSQSIREQMRAWGKSVWWSLLLVIPGLIKFVQYTFVPFVVCLLPGYQEGETDALVTSQKLVAKVAARLVGILLVFSIILPLILSSFQEYRQFSQHLVTSVFFVAVEMILNVLAVIYVFDLFMRSANESHVSVERS